MEVGIKHTVKEIVTLEKTAGAVGSGLLPVYATPAMIALMEKCAAECVAPYIDEGRSSVGTSLHVQHLSASPIGMEITCTATLTAIDGRKLTFSLEASDTKGPIGEGSHERFIIDIDRFMAKCSSKLD